MFAKMQAEAPVLEVMNHACCNLQKGWDQACDKAMGFDDDDDALMEQSCSSPSSIHILNLLDDKATNNTQIQESENHWLDNAHEISASIAQMADMISKNQHGYVSNDLSPEEASVLESTVLSFSATAANQIDALGKAISSTHSEEHDYVQFCHGVVASLMLCLRELVANPMAILQKQRNRTAMTIYQQPLSCSSRLVTSTNHPTSDDSMWDQLVDDEASAPRRGFVPQHAAPSMSTGFMATYARDDNITVSAKPPSMFAKRPSNNDDSVQQPPTKQVKRSSQQTLPVVRQEPMVYHDNQEDLLERQRRQEARDQLQQEALLLEASLQGELDVVYQVEQRMTDITTLLSQFANLVSEQQEEVVAIYDTTVSSKENVSKGQESLVDATERTKRSKHRMATLVWVIAMILLFFNYIVP